MGLKAFTGAAAQMADIVKRRVYADQAKTAGSRGSGIVSLRRDETGAKRLVAVRDFNLSLI